MVDDKLVVHYLSKHHCPLQDAAQHCASKLAQRISEVVTRAEEEEQIPFFILDEVELMPPPLLDILQTFLQSNQTNEFLNVVYIFLSSLGQREITAHVLQNTSTAGAHKPLRRALSLIHPLWTEPSVELIPLSLLEREHVIQCFLRGNDPRRVLPRPQPCRETGGWTGLSHCIWKTVRKNWMQTSSGKSEPALREL